MHRESKQTTCNEPETWNFPAPNAQCVLLTLFSKILEASFNAGGKKREKETFEE